MNIISLNTWGGRAGNTVLLDFFDKYKDIVDIFCLQEMWSGLNENINGNKAGMVFVNTDKIMTEGVSEIAGLLNNHYPYFRPHFMDNYGILMMVRNTIEVIEEGEEFVYKHKDHIPGTDADNHARNIQFVKIERKDDFITVINFHGLWNGNGKTDTADRLQQSIKISNFIKRQHNNVILCGDFNLLPNTESIKIIEDSGMRNLINLYNITSTRTSFYNK